MYIYGIARLPFNPNMPAATQKLVSGIRQCRTPVNDMLGCLGSMS